MKTVMVLLCSVALSALAQTNEKPASLADQYQAIEKDFNTAMSEFSKVYGEAKTDEARQKLVQEKYPRPEKYAPRMRALAGKNPKDPAAADALIWIYRSNIRDPDADKVIDAVLENHLQSEKIGKLVEMLAYSQTPRAGLALQQITAETPHREVKGLATFARGYFIYNSGGRQELTPEAETLFQEVVDKYSDVKGERGLIADQARGILFAGKNIVIDKLSPEIEGEDLEGKKFKLSDYRGKVALIDFWGDW